MNKYNAKDWSVVIDGSFYVTGFDEDMFSVEKDEAVGEFSIGAQGDAVFNEINNDVHTVTLTLQATSPSNKTLIDMYNSRKSFSISITNKNLDRMISGSNAIITEAPSVEGGTEAGSMEYTIQMADGKIAAYSSQATNTASGPRIPAAR